MKTILVTGGAGFIGSHLCEFLLEQGNKVLCLDNFDSYYSEEIKRKNISSFLENKNFVLFEKDIRKKEDLEEVFNFEKIDSVVHLAAKAGVRHSIEFPIEYEKTNIIGTTNLLEIVKKNPVPFVFASSSSVYGDTKPPFKEDSLLKPLNPYSLTKVAGEHLSYYYSRHFKIPITCLRFFSVYGPRIRPDLAIYKFISAINNGNELTKFGDGTTKRDYTFVLDVVNAINLSLIRMSKNNFNVFNIGNGKTILLNELIELIEKELGKKAIVKQIPEKKEDMKQTLADIENAKNYLNFEAKTSFEEGIKKTIDWFLENVEDF